MGDGKILIAYLNSVKSCVRDTINLSCAKIVFPRVINVKHVVTCIKYEFLNCNGPYPENASFCELQMASIYLKKLIALLLTSMISIVVPAAGNALLTAEQRHIALCVQTIAQHYLNHGRSTVVSMPPELRNNSRRPLIYFPYSDDLQLVDLLLQYVHKDTC